MGKENMGRFVWMWIQCSSNMEGLTVVYLPLRLLQNWLTARIQLVSLMHKVQSGITFLLSLENRKIEPFPHARKPATICIRNIVSIELYCVCKLPEAGNMVCCDLCNNWYHYHCVGLQEQEDLPEQWFCQYCKPPQKKRRLYWLLACKFLTMYYYFWHIMVMLVFYIVVYSCVQAFWTTAEKTP